MSTLTSILNEECPKCRNARMFVHPPLHWKDFTLMKENCPSCGLKFQVEPGFFIGAMYVSYGFIVGIMLTTALILYNFFGNPEAWVYTTTVILTSGLLLPFIYRYSRILFLFWFGGVEYQR